MEDEKFTGVNPEAPSEGEDNAAPVQDPIVDESQKRFQLGSVVVVLVLVALGVAFFLFQDKLGNLFESKNVFGIPVYGEYVVLYDAGSLYSFDTKSEDLKELGSFSLNDIPIGKTHEIAISANLSSVALAVPKSGGSEIVLFSSYEDSRSIVSRNSVVNALAVSDNNIIIFGEGNVELNKNRNLFSVLPVIDNTARTLGKGSSPFFLDGGNYAVLGTSFGFKLLDFVYGDTLDTETPNIAVAEALSVSRDGKYMSVTDKEGVTSAYNIISTRPINFSSEFILPVPGAYNAAISSDGDVAVLVEEDGNVFLSVYEGVGLITYQLPLSLDVNLISWNK